ncbi:DUF2059 domain-containing protein [Chromobacterium sp. IIBBL 290-4]|uniref:DUF2059 domain-containing protein n=1 Tax=Chromobacterium sp. IIBBL 290-4 TaxID=2953890 RepID=UPI0020B87F2F|nr:DUF2059 domain-containing protein [Chromobacterium sp. IIBBL 290-4]UTH75978.1 DUF2059 domain-containing protein [Chromobacterium sp. IIBBL 290-4]
MQLKRFLAGAMLCASFTAPSLAASPAQHQAALQLLATINVDQNLDAVQSKLLPIMTQQLKSQLDSQGCGATPDCKQKLQSAFDKMQILITQYFASPQLRQLLKRSMADFYEANFTLDEIRQIDAFYRTPAGKKQLQMGPQAAAQLMPALMQDMQTHLNPKLKALTDELKQ